MVSSFFVLKVKYTTLLFAVWVLCYFAIGRNPLNISTFDITMAIDNKIMFIPETVYFYVSCYLFIFIPLFVIKSANQLKRFSLAILIVYIISFTIFLFFPVRIYSFDLPEGNSLSLKFLKFIKAVDSPLNCFPSMHVSLCLLAAICSFNYSKLVGYLTLTLWSFIALSTLTVKQHYLLDVLGGIIVGLIAGLALKVYNFNDLN